MRKLSLVIEIGEDDKVCNYRDEVNELTSDKVNNKFLILNGLEYQSLVDEDDSYEDDPPEENNEPKCKLLYMEV